MAKGQSAQLDRKKLMADPIMMTTIVLLITFLTLFILYPLAILLVDSLYGSNGFSLDTFKRIFGMWTFRRAITNTLKVGLVVGLLSTLIGLLFAYVEVYVKMRKAVGGLFKVVSMLPVVSPPFVLSLSMIMLFGRSGLITRFMLGIYDSDIYGYWGIVIVQTMTFFPVCYMMLKGLLKNIDPSMEEASRDMGASRWKVFTTVTLPLLLPGLGNAFLVTFIESIADFANPMIIGGSYDTLATTIYLQITGAMDKEGAAAKGDQKRSVRVIREDFRQGFQLDGAEAGLAFACEDIGDGASPGVLDVAVEVDEPASEEGGGLLPGAALA